MTIPTTMIEIDPAEPGGPEVLIPVERPVPQPGPGEVLIKVAAAGVNRPGMMQREGKYPPPPGAPPSSASNWRARSWHSAKAAMRGCSGGR